MNYKRAVVICIPVLLVGGTEIQTLLLAKTLISNGYKIVILCYYEFDSTIVHKFEECGAKVELLELNKAKGLFYLIAKLFKIFRKLKPDIVHVQYIAPGLAPIIAAKLSRIKTIFATVHQPGRVYGKKPKNFIRIAARLCTAFFCVSKSAEESWFGSSEIFNAKKPNKDRKHYTIYNTVDATKINRIKKNSNKLAIKKSLKIENKKIIGVVGRLREEKGHSLLLNAFKELLAEHSDLLLMVIGDGPDREILKKQSATLDIEKNVLWTGIKDQNEVFELYAIMDILVMPSVYEGFGLVAIEAMSAGIPVVASNIDGLNEIITHNENGLLFSQGNKTELTVQLKKLLNSEKDIKHLGENGKTSVKKNFSFENFSNNISSAYHFFSN